jgi:hypothetical protein
MAEQVQVQQQQQRLANLASSASPAVSGTPGAPSSPATTVRVTSTASPSTLAANPMAGAATASTQMGSTVVMNTISSASSTNTQHTLLLQGSGGANIQGSAVVYFFYFYYIFNVIKTSILVGLYPTGSTTSCTSKCDRYTYSTSIRYFNRTRSCCWSQSSAFPTASRHNCFWKPGCWTNCGHCWKLGSCTSGGSHASIRRYSCLWGRSIEHRHYYCGRCQQRSFSDSRSDRWDYCGLAGNRNNQDSHTDANTVFTATGIG